MTFTLIMAFSIIANAAGEQLAADYTGKTVILSTNDVHGAVGGYQYVAGLKEELKNRGAHVILVDAGDYTQGSTYVNESKGDTAIELMLMCGYNYATIGNHEFDYGQDRLDANLDKAISGGMKIVCCNLLDKATQKAGYLGSDIYEDKSSGLKIGFVGIATPESQTKSNPANVKDICFPDNDDKFAVVQDEVDKLREGGADIVIGISHLGVAEESSFNRNRSIDMLEMVNGIDLMLDGHSHTVMTEGPGGEPVMSTGTKFMNIGVTVIDEHSKKLEKRFLYHLRDKDGDKYDDSYSDEKVKEYADKLIEEVKKIYEARVGESLVFLNGERGSETEPGGRVCETNFGDLVADAMRWYVLKDAVDLGVDNKHVIAIQNGGAIRASISKGDFTRNDVLNALPYPNTIAAVTVTGDVLLEALEASTYCNPSPVGGFPQVSGIKCTINSLYYYDAGEQYPNSTYNKPKSIRRIRIDSINGEPFDINGKYVVLTNDFCASGGDTYYALANSSSQFDTGITVEYAVTRYIIDHLGAVIDETYKDPQGRIVINSKATTEEAVNAINDLPSAVAEDCRNQVEEARRLFSSLKPEEQSSKQLEAARLEAAEAKLDASSANASAFEAMTEADKANEGLQAAQETIETLKDEVANLTSQVGKLTVQSQKVTGLKAKSKKGGKAVVAYKSLGDGYTYKILRSTSKSSGYKSVCTTTKTNVTVKGLKKGKIYYFKVKACKTIAGSKVYTATGKPVKIKAK